MDGSTSRSHVGATTQKNRTMALHFWKLYWKLNETNLRKNPQYYIIHTQKGGHTWWLGCARSSIQPTNFLLILYAKIEKILDIMDKFNLSHTWGFITTSYINSIYLKLIWRKFSPFKKKLWMDAWTRWNLLVWIVPYLVRM